MNPPLPAQRGAGRGAGLALLLFATCTPTPPPGDTAMGTYALAATGGVRSYELDGGVVAGASCELEEVTAADFGFEAVLTRDSASDGAWVTLNGYSRPGTWDGQVLHREASASRVFAACERCATRVVEVLSLALLSRSQDEALGGACPANALDGGVPAPDDAGITAPVQRATGFDAVRACGVLETVVVALGEQDGGACDPKCGGCTVRYQLRGDRR